MKVKDLKPGQILLWKSDKHWRGKVRTLLKHMPMTDPYLGPPVATILPMILSDGQNLAIDEEFVMYSEDVAYYEVDKEPEPQEDVAPINVPSTTKYMKEFGL